MRTILEYTENNLIYMIVLWGVMIPSSCFLESHRRKEGGEKGQRRTEGVERNFTALSKTTGRQLMFLSVRRTERCCTRHRIWSW